MHEKDETKHLIKQLKLKSNPDKIREAHKKQ